MKGDASKFKLQEMENKAFMIAGFATYKSIPGIANASNIEAALDDNTCAALRQVLQAGVLPLNPNCETAAHVGDFLFGLLHSKKDVHSTKKKYSQHVPLLHLTSEETVCVQLYLSYLLQLQQVYGVNSIHGMNVSYVKAACFHALGHLALAILNFQQAQLRGEFITETNFCDYEFCFHDAIYFQSTALYNFMTAFPEVTYPMEKRVVVPLLAFFVYEKGNAAEARSQISNFDSLMKLLELYGHDFKDGWFVKQAEKMVQSWISLVQRSSPVEPLHELLPRMLELIYWGSLQVDPTTFLPQLLPDRFQESETNIMDCILGMAVTCPNPKLREQWQEIAETNILPALTPSCRNIFALKGKVRALLEMYGFIHNDSNLRYQRLCAKLPPKAMRLEEKKEGSKKEGAFKVCSRIKTTLEELIKTYPELLKVLCLVEHFIDNEGVYPGDLMLEIQISGNTHILDIEVDGNHHYVMFPSPHPEKTRLQGRDRFRDLALATNLANLANQQGLVAHIARIPIWEQEYSILQGLLLHHKSQLQELGIEALIRHALHNQNMTDAKSKEGYMKVIQNRITFIAHYVRTMGPVQRRLLEDKWIKEKDAIQKFTSRPTSKYHWAAILEQRRCRRLRPLRFVETAEDVVDEILRLTEKADLAKFLQGLPELSSWTTKTWELCSDFLPAAPTASTSPEQMERDFFLRCPLLTVILLQMMRQIQSLKLSKVAKRNPFLEFQRRVEHVLGHPEEYAAARHGSVPSSPTSSHCDAPASSVGGSIRSLCSAPPTPPNGLIRNSDFPQLAPVSTPPLTYTAVELTAEAASSQPGTSTSDSDRQ